MLHALKTKPPPLMSRARTTLADHLATIASAQAEAERLRRPVDVLKARIEAAEAAQREARAECSRLTDEHAAALTSWATSGGKGSEPASRDQDRADAIAKAENAIQMLAAARKALAEAETPLNDVQRKLAELRRRAGELILDVVAEEADEALETLEAVRRDAAAAEARTRGLTNMLSDRGRELQSRNEAPETASQFFRVAEMINTRLHNMRSPEPAGREVEAEANRWAETLNRLATDPSASIE